MDDELVEVIVAKLKELGYKNVQSNAGTIWYDDSAGNSYSIAEMACEQ